MRHSVVVVLLLLAGAARADEAGRAVVVGGGEQPVTPCFPCHGLEGAGDSAGAFPRMAGQPGYYLYKQLLDYAAGTRPNEVMGPIAKQLTDKQAEDVAAWYAAAKAPYAPVPEIPEDVRALAEGINRNGLPERGVQACALCHGAEGQGFPPGIPALMGQYAPYTELQLRLWKEGKRHNDPLGVMSTIARALNDEEIRALALYFETRRPGGAVAARD